MITTTTPCEYPIIFAAPLIAAIQEHRKWQTRRVIPVDPQKVTRIDGTQYWIGDICVGSPYQPGDFLQVKGAPLRLLITAVQIERLQKLKRDDALAEGLEVMRLDDGEKFYRDYSRKIGWTSDVKHSFQTYWDTLHVRRGYSWQSNPLVWVITFTLPK